MRRIPCVTVDSEPPTPMKYLPLLGAFWLLGSCQNLPPGPLLTAASPAILESGKTSAVTLSGRFDPPLQVSFVSKTDTFVHTDFRAYFGANEFPTVTYVDAQTLLATLPAHPAPGTYDVEVVAPDETFSWLAGGLAILPPASADPNSAASRAIQALLSVEPLAGDTNTLFSGNVRASTSPQNPNLKLYFAWDWQGTGQFKSLARVPTSTHRFNKAGSYTVHLAVFDLAGARADAYVTVVVANEGKLLHVQDANDSSPVGLNLRQALTLANASAEPMVITVDRPMRVMLASPLSLGGSGQIILQADGLTLDGSSLRAGSPPNHLADVDTSPTPCLTVEGVGHGVRGVEFQSCDLAVLVRGQGNTLSNLYVHDSNSAVWVSGRHNTIGPSNHFTGLPQLGVRVTGPSRISNNVIEAMGDAALELGAGSHDTFVLFNVLTHNTTAVRLAAGTHGAHLWANTLDAAGIGVDAQGATQADLRNNILTRLGTPLANPAAFEICDGNDFFNNPNDVRCTLGSRNFSEDPQFQSAGACGAYTLGDNSPLFQAGVALEDSSATWVGACGP